MIKGENIFLRPFIIDDAIELLELLTRNRDFFEKFSMERNEDFYTVEEQLEVFRYMKKLAEQIRPITLVFLKRTGP